MTAYKLISLLTFFMNLTVSINLLFLKSKIMWEIKNKIIWSNCSIKILKDWIRGCRKAKILLLKLNNLNLLEIILCWLQIKSLPKNKKIKLSLKELLKNNWKMILKSFKIKNNKNIKKQIFKNNYKLEKL